MGLDWWWLLVFAGVILALLFPVLVGLPRVAIDRRPEHEGFDDVSTGAGYAEIMDRLEFKSMRRSVVNHVLPIMASGELGTLARPLHVLDIGCGTGHLIKDIHDACTRRGVKVTMHGIDIGAASISECKKFLARAGLHDIDITEEDGARMPLPDGSMDIVVTSLSLHHWSNPEAVLAEIHRVLKQGGHVVLFDLRRDARKLFHHAFHHWFTPRMPEPLKSAGDPYRSMLASYTPAEIATMLGKTPWAMERFRIIPRSIAIYVDGTRGAT